MSDIDAVLFDLDGTLIDTAPDMVRALNVILAAEGRPALPLAVGRPHVSNGATGLLRAAFGDDPSIAEGSSRHAAFLQHYAADLARESRLFPGMADALARIEAAGLAWGVVTNKPGWLTDPLLRALDLERRAACVVSGDTVARRKPAPDPILHACACLDTTPARTVYVGDAERDIAAGRAAGSRTLVALFGYIEPGGDPFAWGADGMLAEPAELRHHLARGATTASDG